MSKCRTEIQCSHFFVNLWRQCAAPWIHRHHQRATPFGTFWRPSRLLVRQTQKLVLWSLSSTWTCLCLFWFFLGVWRPRVWSMDIWDISLGTTAQKEKGVDVSVLHFESFWYIPSTHLKAFEESVHNTDLRRAATSAVAWGGGDRHQRSPMTIATIVSWMWT